MILSKDEIRNDATLDFHSVHQIYSVYKFLSFIKIIYAIYLFSQVYKVNQKLLSLLLFRWNSGSSTLALTLEIPMLIVYS